MEFSHSNATEITFQIPAKLQTIRIDVQGSISYMNSVNSRPISHSHAIQFNSFAGSNAFTYCYLRAGEKGYEIAVLGKNGETKPKMLIDI